MGKRLTEEDYSRRAENWKENPYDQDEDIDGHERPLEAGGLKRQGYLLIFGGLMMVLFLVVSPDYLLYWYHFPLMSGLAILAIAAGLKLIKPRRLDGSGKDE